MGYNWEKLTMKRIIMLLLAVVFAVNFASSAKWTALHIDCTNDDNVACLKWTEQNVDFSGCVYVQIDLIKVARKNVNVLVNISDGHRLIQQKVITVEKGEETSYAKEIYLGKSMEGQTIHFTIESISCN